MKPWYLSKTIIGIVAALLLQIFRRLGIDVVPADATEIAMLLLDLASAVAAGIAVHGRVSATQLIGKPPEAPGAPRVAIAILLAGLLALGGPSACSTLSSPYTGDTPAQQLIAAKAYATPAINAAATYLEQGDPSPETKAVIKEVVVTIRDTMAKAEAAHAAAALSEYMPLIEAAIDGVTEAVEAVSLMKQLHAEGRDPTPEEEAKVDAAFQAAVNRVLQA